MPSEDAILFAVKEALIARGWAILAYCAPGGHGGFTVEASDVKDYPGARVVFDLVAYRRPWVICLEAKARFSDRDRAKLDRVLGHPELRGRVLAKVARSLPRVTAEVLKLVKAQAYGEGPSVAEDYVLFTVDEAGNVRADFGSEHADLAAAW